MPSGADSLRGHVFGGGLAQPGLPGVCLMPCRRDMDTFTMRKDKDNLKKILDIFLFLKSSDSLSHTLIGVMMISKPPILFHLLGLKDIATRFAAAKPEHFDLRRETLSCRHSGCLQPAQLLFVPWPENQKSV